MATFTKHGGTPAGFRSSGLKGNRSRRGLRKRERMWRPARRAYWQGGARAEAARFLAEAAGKLRDPVSLRWRRASELMTAGDVDAALDRLYDAMLRGLGLPELVYGALVPPTDAPLTSLQRRELIYLA